MRLLSDRSQMTSKCPRDYFLRACRLLGRPALDFKHHYVKCSRLNHNSYFVIVWSCTYLKGLLSDGLRFRNRHFLQVAEKPLLSPRKVWWSDVNRLILTELLLCKHSITRDELLPKIVRYLSQTSKCSLRLDVCPSDVSGFSWNKLARIEIILSVSWNRLFAWSSHMVLNKLYWDATNAMGLSKQRKAGLDCYEFVCQVPLRYLRPSMHNLFRTMLPDRAKGLFST